MFSKIGLIILAAVFALVPVSTVQANSLVPNETHYYTVQLRSDKRALNYARIVFENNQSEGEQNTYKFSLPKDTKVQSLSVKQVLAKKKDDSTKPPCKEYETFDDWYQRTNQRNLSTTGSTKTPDQQAVYENEKVCIQQDENTSPYDEDYDYVNNISSNSYNYRYYTYYDRNDEKFDYSDLKLEEKDGKYTAHLSNSIKPGKQGSVLVSYIAEDLITGFMGKYNYNYRTLVSKNMISNVTVAINFDKEMYSREAKQKRSYESSSTSISNDIAAGAPASPSRSTDDLLLSVGRGGVYTKSQSNLLPGDVMSVKGVYANSPLQLFLAEIFIALLALAAVVLWVIVWRRHNRSKGSKTPVDTKDSPADLPSLDNPTDTQTPVVRTVLLSDKKLVAISAISIAVAVAISVIWLGLIGLMTGRYSIDMEAYILAGVVSWLIMVLFAIFALPLAFVAKYGLGTIARWVIVHFVVISISSLLLIFILFLLSSGYSTMPMYDY